MFGSTVSTNYPVTNGSTNSGGYDFAVTKLDSNGAIIFSTYLGGNDYDEPTKMEVQNGNIYLFGSVFSTDYPVTDGSTRVANDGTQVFVVTRLNSSGAIVYSKYIGTNGDEYAGDMLVDNGNMYITGTVIYGGYPVTDGSVVKVGDMAIAKIDSNGTIVYSTLFGGSNFDAPGKMRMVNGDLYLLGYTGSADFPVTNGSTFSGGYDITVTKFSSTGAVLFSTMLGGSDYDTPGEMEIVNGDIYITGTTRSSNYPVTNGSTKLGASIKSDIVFTKLNASGTICYSTFLGGSETENPSPIQIENGNAYIGGSTYSNDFPVTTGTSFGGNSDFFCYKNKILPTS